MKASRILSITKGIGVFLLVSGYVFTSFVNHRPSTALKDMSDLPNPLFAALVAKDQAKLAELITANRSILNSRDKEGRNAMHFIAHKGHYQYPPQEIPKMLIDYGIDVNAKDGRGVSALEISLLSGWQRIAILLLDHGADRTVVTDEVKSKITCPDSKRVVREYKL